MHGRENVARYVAGLVARFTEGLLPAFVEVNGAPAVAFTDGENLRGVLVLHADGGRLTALDLVVNPEKLTYAQGQRSRIRGLPGLSG